MKYYLKETAKTIFKENLITTIIVIVVTINTVNMVIIINIATIILLVSFFSSFFLLLLEYFSLRIQSNEFFPTPTNSFFSIFWGTAMEIRHFCFFVLPLPKICYM